MYETIEDGSLMIMDFFFKGDNFTKLAMFDFDNTLATYNGLDKMGVWKLQFRNVREKLIELDSSGYKIVILTNQSQITSKEKIFKNFVNKIESFQMVVDLPMLVLVAQKRDKFRKPSIWAYKWLKEKYFKDSVLEDQFYVGDAAGDRENAPYPINCDLYFAKNAGLRFYLPEEYFQNKSPNYKYQPINIRDYSGKSFNCSKKRIIFLYGLKKYNGKYFFAKKYYPDYNIFESTTACSDKCLYINCNNISFLKKVINEHPDDYKIYLLDYPNKVEAWLKEFYFVNGQYQEKSFTPIKNKVLNFIKDKCEKVPFIFDDSSFTEEELEISRFDLE